MAYLVAFRGIALAIAPLAMNFFILICFAEKSRRDGPRFSSQEKSALNCVRAKDTEGPRKQANFFATTARAAPKDFGRVAVMPSIFGMARMVRLITESRSYPRRSAFSLIAKRPCSGSANKFLF